MDLNCVYHFMRAYKSLFVTIRSNTKGLYYIDLLKTFEKYIDLDLSAKKIAKLKNDFDQIENIDIIEKNYLKNDLDVYKYNEGFNDVEKLKNYIYALQVVTKEMIKLLERKEHERVHDFADAVHNFPEFLVTDFWSAGEYYKIYIKPYNEKWKDTFLCELESRNKIRAFLSKFIHSS
ncbi:MAG TPA: hypothetical protein PK566_17025 [Pseudobacteroides sp.]|nr:hypothetical protein [Pseudobacteroides sp.]